MADKNVKGECKASSQIPDGVIVDIKTTMGDIKALLYNDTPLHRDNFIKLVKDGYYDGVLFHRVINDFMIQTGDPTSKDAAPGVMLGSGSPDYTIEAEITYPKHFHKYGSLAAARSGDEVNPERRSSGSQFYIVTGKKFPEGSLAAIEQRQMNDKLQNKFRQLTIAHRQEIDSLMKAENKEALEALRQRLIAETEASVKYDSIPDNIRQVYATMGGTPHLDGAYTVFGEVLEGMDVVEKIQKVETDRNDRPVSDVRIISAKIEEK